MSTQTNEALKQNSLARTHFTIGTTEQLIREQYCHLPADETPLPGGAIVDVRSGIQQNASAAERTSKAIQEKRSVTKNWVQEKYGSDFAPIYLTRPTVFVDSFPPELQMKGAEWMSQVIREVYGDGYPLPNIHPEFNLQGIKAGLLLPYIGLIGPSHLHNGRVYEEPNELFDPRIKPVCAAAIILGTSGFGELGRNARSPQYHDDTGGFEGATIALERGYDWFRNRHRLMEIIHTMTSDIRAADAHGHSPSSGPVQRLTMGPEMGMKIRAAVAMYDVNDPEPFLSVYKPRDIERLRQVNRDRTLFTPSGPHIELLQALWQHQMEQPVRIETYQDPENRYTIGIPHDNGDHVYTMVEVEGPPFQDGQQPLSQILPYLEERTPVTNIIKIEAETPQSAATQQWLMEEGYIVCGVDPAREEDHLVMGKDGLSVEYHYAPIHVYMARLGNKIVRGEKQLAPAYYPTPKDAKGIDLHGDRLRTYLYNLDAQFRQQIHRK